MQTKREYLITLGLAKAGRGKFSQAGQEALAKAISQGMKFSDLDAPKAKPKVVRNDSQTVKADKPSRSSVVIPADSFDPKAVRVWAKSQGIAVADRGRIHADVVAQYLDAVPDAPKRSEAEPSASAWGDEAPRIRMHEWYSAQDVDGGKIVKSYRDCCNSCGYSIGWCYCPTGPMAFNSDFVKVALTAGK